MILKIKGLSLGRKTALHSANLGSAEPFKVVKLSNILEEIEVTKNLSFIDGRKLI